MLREENNSSAAVTIRPTSESRYSSKWRHVRGRTDPKVLVRHGWCIATSQSAPRWILVHSRACRWKRHIKRRGPRLARWRFVECVRWRLHETDGGVRTGLWMAVTSICRRSRDCAALPKNADLLQWRDLKAWLNLFVIGQSRRLVFGKGERKNGEGERIAEARALAAAQELCTSIVKIRQL